ncbi:hypothetical protein ACP70R_036233 [Stipagrostis hirtigluma subsp. patula]
MSTGHCHGNGYGHQPQPTVHYHRTSTEVVTKVVADTPACHGAAEQQLVACGGAGHNAGVRGYGFGEAQGRETYEETCEEYEATTYEETSYYEVREMSKENGIGNGKRREKSRSFFSLSSY